MQIAGDARTLGNASNQRHSELMMQLPNPQLVGRPQQRHKNRCPECTKPIRLVIRGSDGKIQLGGIVVPAAVTGIPARISALRAMFMPVVPCGMAQPITTSSTSPTSMPARDTALEIA